MEKISVREKLAYGAANIPNNFILTLVSMFLLPFCASIGMNLVVVGMIMFGTRIFDILTDFFMGYWVDKTDTKWGKAKPFILWYAVPFATCLVLLFTNIETMMLIKYIYFGLVYNLLIAFIYTGISIPYSLLNLYITEDKKERTSLHTYAITFGAITGFLVVLFLESFAKGILGPMGSMIFFGIVSAILLILCFFGTKERVKRVKENTYSFTDLKYMFSKSLIKTQIINFLYNFKLEAQDVSAIFLMFAFFNGKGEIMNILLLFMALNFIAKLIILAFTPRILTKINKRTYLIISNIVFIIGLTTLFIFCNAGLITIASCAIILFIINMAIAPQDWAPGPLNWDVIAENKDNSGKLIEGPLFGSSIIVKKLAKAIAAPVLALVISKAGLSGIEMTNLTVVHALPVLSLYCLVPIVLSIIIILLFLSYKNKHDTVLV